ncbi:MAG TPA: ATP-dependent DNA helicase RecG [Candidatus Saccharimonadales bacterium]|nr:ATP-dependent DNA helicase RecG [Candidatus Saccharimonadales bacterium]
MKLDDPITVLKGVGPSLSQKLAILGIETVGDLIRHFPRRYNDFSHIIKIKDIKPGPVTILCKVVKITARYARRGLHITDVIVEDGTGELRVVWFNQPYREAHLKAGGKFYMSGTFDLQRDRYILQNPAVEQVSNFSKNTARIVPIYPETKGLKSNQIRQLIFLLLPYIKELPETLPASVVKSNQLLSYSEAMTQIHFPESDTLLARAKERLGFEELFELLLASQLNKQDRASNPSWAIEYRQNAADTFINQLSFTLTDAQRLAAWEILQDISKNQPMNRLLQGDVGAGKTVVAALAAFMAHSNNLQAAFMAPTEVLAAQHADTLQRLLNETGVEVGLLVGSVKKKPREELLKRLRSGDIDIVVGTHALIQNGVDFAKLGLIVVDEQHRFGVDQRKVLLAKGSNMPHILSMTATPIPRSLMLTVYGELDVSIIKTPPANRKPVITKIIQPTNRAKAYQMIEDELAKGHQAYIICPLVSESDVLGFTSVEEEYAKLTKEKIFKDRQIGKLHGKLSSQEKDDVMSQFKVARFDILVATTVVEVGVDVPNATIMLIEGADRFGLAQLHQLRGRVGRSDAQSYCVLIPSSVKASSKRLQELANSNDGFYLAERDLELRGPGELYGYRQHGTIDLRIARMTDTRFLYLVQQAVEKFLATKPDLLQYPQLRQRVEYLRRLTVLN